LESDSTAVKVAFYKTSFKFSDAAKRMFTVFIFVAVTSASVAAPSL
jgi:hypothetical protein